MGTLSILNRKSETHNSCEDTLWVDQNSKWIFGGVFDGCSTGINSHWASQTLAYLFRQSIFSLYAINPIQALSDIAIKLIIGNIRALALAMGLDCMNFLSTAILFVYSKDTKVLYIRCFGDGVYYINDVEYIIEQNNTPDYLGYLINKNTEDINEYLKKYPVQTYDEVSRFIICSDGIQQVQAPQLLDTDPTIDVSKLLALPNNTYYLIRMYNLLKQQKFILNDDLSIISYANT